MIESWLSQTYFLHYTSARESYSNWELSFPPEGHGTRTSLETQSKQSGKIVREAFRTCWVKETPKLNPFFDATVVSLSEMESRNKNTLETKSGNHIPHLLANSKGSEQNVTFWIPFSCLCVYLKTTGSSICKWKTIYKCFFGLGTFIEFNISNN